MIVHFTRASVGQAFLIAAANFERETGIAVRTVLSGRTDRPPAGLKALVRRALGRDGLGRRRGGVDWITDVNDPAFLTTIPAGAHGVVTYFDQIFREDAIERFASLVNFHGSLLPYYRGPVPTRWVVNNGERRTGITIHDIEARVDEGRIRYQKVFDVPPGGIAALDDASTKAMVGPFVRWLRHIGTGAPFTESTVDADAVYTTRPSYGVNVPVSS